MRPNGLNTYAAYHVMRGGVDPWGLNERTTDEDFERATGQNRNAFDNMTAVEGVHGKTFSAKNCMSKKGCNINFKFEKALIGDYLSRGAQTPIRGVYVKISTTIEDRSICCCDKITFIQTVRYTTMNDAGEIIPARPVGVIRRVRAGWPPAQDDQAPGWGVDSRRTDGRYGGDGRLDGNNGSQPLPPGQATPAELWDAPGSRNNVKNIGKDFETCAICEHDGKVKVLACVKWGYYTNRQGNISFTPNPPKTSCNSSTLGGTVERWNTIAAGRDDHDSITIDDYGSQWEAE